MIQRIQSIFLAVVVVLAGLSFLFPAWTATLGPGTYSLTNISLQYEASVALVSGRSIEVDKATLSTWYCALMATSTGILALVTILRFNSRTLQNQLSHFGTFLSILWVGAYSIAITKAKEGILVPDGGSLGISFFLPIASILLFQAAAYFIRKDEELVRSADRIR